MTANFIPTDQEKQLFDAISIAHELEIAQLIDNFYHESNDKEGSLLRIKELFRIPLNDSFQWIITKGQIDRVFEAILAIQNRSTSIKSIDGIKQPTNRVIAIAHNFKVDAGEAKTLSRPEKRSLGGKTLEKAFDEVDPRTKNKAFRKATKKELENAQTLLTGFPKALAMISKAIEAAE